MFKAKSPGLKILWVWTFGTAAVLVASVVKTRVNDMEKFVKSEEQQQKPPQQSVNPNEPTIIMDDDVHKDS